MSTIFCPHCGMANREGSNFCNRCGTELQESVDAPLSQSENENAGSEEYISVAEQRPNEPMPDIPHTESTEPPDGAPAPDDQLLATQPWLRVDEVMPIDDESADGSHVEGFDTDRFYSSSEDDFSDSVPNTRSEAEDEGLGGRSERLIIGVQGLLDPLGLSSEMSSDTDSMINSGIANPDADDTIYTDPNYNDPNYNDPMMRPIDGAITPESGIFAVTDPAVTDPAEDDPIGLSRQPKSYATSTTKEISDQQLRQIQRLMTEEPMLKESHLTTGPPTYPSLRIPWIFWLIGLALGLPVFWGLNFPIGTPQAWPGVAEAYDEIAALPTESTVLLFWAYDPTTAGELDRVAFPVMRHLLERRSQLVVVSLLPNGPATAQRLLNQVVKDVYNNDERIPPVNQPTIINGGFLPGGTATLPLLGQNLVEGLSTKREALNAILSPTGQPDMTVVIANQAEDVQHWLEQVQPLNRRPVVALVSAGADPMLRPYLNSKQLSGLVSGFDGASTYVARMEQPQSQTEKQKLQTQIVSLNWGLITLLVIVIVGNLTAFNQRRE